MNDLVVIIIAAGKGTRWGNHLGLPKHFIKIEGERLIDRMVRLVKENAPNAKIYVVGSDDRYAIPGTELFIPEESPKPHTLDLFMSSKSLWNKNGRTITLLGDCWYSNEAMKTIFSNENKDWTVFCRLVPSEITFKPWREDWACSFYPDDHDKFEEAIKWSETISDDSATGWYAFGYMEGQKDPALLEYTDKFVNIDDFTEDFDFPHDYEIWLDARLQWEKTKQVSPKSRNDITFCGVYRNESSRVRNVLDIAKYLCKNILLAVQKSEDNTAEICRKYTSNVINAPAESPEITKDKLMEKVTTPWVFYLDGDEVPSLSLIHFIETFDINQFKGYDAIRVPRINYIDGNTIEVNEGEDRQFRLLKSYVRWKALSRDTVVHIDPIVNSYFDVGYPVYHHRSFEKIDKMTDRWNELEPRTQLACNKYRERVKEELENVRSRG